MVGPLGFEPRASWRYPPQNPLFSMFKNFEDFKRVSQLLTMGYSVEV